MIVELLANLLAALTMAVVLLAAGARLRRILRLPAPPRLRLPVDFTLGSGVAGLTVVLIGVAGWLSASSLLSVLAVLAVAGRWRWRQWRLGPLTAPTLGALPLLPVALAPPFFYDALIYHLGLPWLALLEGRWAPHPETLYASSPPLFQCLAIAPLSVDLERAPAVLHLLAFVAAGTAVDALARALGARRWAARLAGFVVPLAPLHVLVPGLPAAEGWGALAVVVALGVLAGQRPRRGAASLAGVVMGIGLAARVQILPFVILAAITLVVRLRRPGAVAAFAVALVAGSSPWWLKNLILLGNPLLPLGFSGAGVEAMWRDAVSTMHTARRLGDFLHPYVSDLGPHAAILLPLALAGLLLVVRRRGEREVILAGVLVAALVAWALTAAIPRYLAPWIALLLAVAAAASTVPAGRWAAGLALASAAALSLAVTVAHTRRIGGLDLVLAPRGEVEQELVIANPLPAFAAARALPPSARVLFVGEPRGFAFPRRFVAPSYYDASPLRAVIEDASTVAGARRTLLSQGYTHLLVNWGELQRLATGYPVVPFATPAGASRFEKLLELMRPAIVEVGGIEVFDLTSDRRR